jgi:hypothetical protein
VTVHSTPAAQVYPRRTTILATDRPRTQSLGWGGAPDFGWGWAANLGVNATRWFTFSVAADNGAQNNTIVWEDILLDAGTYEIDLFHFTGAGYGIYSVQIDGVEVGTIDGYAAAGARAFTRLTGIAIAAAGRHSVGLVMATKNVASGGYQGEISAITVVRTAA